MTEYFMSLFALFVEGGGVTSRQIIASTTDEEYPPSPRALPGGLRRHWHPIAGRDTQFVGD